MEDLFTKELKIESDFSYKKLFSDTKSSATDKNYNKLIKSSIEDGSIQIKKFLISENVQEELLEIGEWKVKSHKLVKAVLKDWHMESDYSLSPVIYILERLAPNFSVEYDSELGKVKINSEKNIISGHRFKKEVSFARLYLPDEKTIINLCSDSITNLINILTVEDINLYLLDVEWIDGDCRRLVAYKLISTPVYRKKRQKLEDDLIGEVYTKMEDAIHGKK